MLDMKALFRNVTGKDDQIITAEELDRVQITAESGNIFFEFYRNNSVQAISIFRKFAYSMHP